MPRHGREQQIKNGTLSPNLAAELTEVSPNTIRSIVEKGSLRPITFEGTRDLRVSALELLRLWIHRKLPFRRDLLVAARCYAVFNEPARIEEIDACIKTFDKNQKLLVAGPQPAEPAATETTTEEVSTGKTEKPNVS